MTLTLLSYNIRYGGVGREKPLATVIAAHAPDLVVLQEATRPAVIEQLAGALGMPLWGSKMGRSLGYMSRVPLARVEWRKPRWSKHAFLELTLKEAPVAVFGVHLSAVHSNWTERRRLVEAGSLLADIRKRDRGFHVVVGDFNTLAPGEQLDLAKLPPRLRTITYLTGRRIRWQTVNLMLEADYVDGYRLRCPEGRGYTFPTWDPHLRLDYAFVPRDHADQLTACEVASHDHGRAASDHFGLLMRIET